MNRSPGQHRDPIADSAKPIPADRRPEAGPIAILPEPVEPFTSAVTAGGGTIAPLSQETRGIIYLDSGDSSQLVAALEAHPAIGWVQLPWAGVDAFGDVLAAHADSASPIWTSAKGAYSEPVAEHALTLTLALMRMLPEKARSTSWAARREGISLFGRRVVIIGAGGVALETMRLLAPFDVDVTVVRRSAGDVAGAHRTVLVSELDSVLTDADAVIIAAASTGETKHLIDARRLALMKTTAVLVNIARGSLVDSDALDASLRSGHLWGAGLDVTDPEPLPNGHPLWSAPRCVITSHCADTPEMVEPLLAERVRLNVDAFVGDGRFVGVVDPGAGVLSMSTWFAGSYGPDAGGTGDGIVALRSTELGTLEVVGTVDATPSPSALLLHGDHLYAVIEGPGEGFVQSWRVSGTHLQLDGRASSGGTAPCNLAVYDGRLVATNYGDGVLGIIGMDAAGAVTSLVQAIAGPSGVHGPHPDQDGSRQHATIVIDDVLVTVDLGADELQLHRVVHGAVQRVGAFALPRGTGPRDIARHPSGLFVVVGELDATMHLLEWSRAEWNGEGSTGGFVHLDSVQLPQIEGEHAAALAFSADGSFAFTALRRSNRVAVVDVDVAARSLSFSGVVGGGGTWGRHLAVDGDVLHVANQLSNGVTSFRIGTNGIPEQLAPGTALGSPTFLLRVP